MGTAVIEPFQRYELYYKQEPNGDEAYIYFDGNTRPVINGQLGVWQTADLPPGIYTLRMRVVKTDGNYSEHFAPNLSVNQQSATPTPTATPDEPTPTPVPIDTPTPVPQPTPAVVDVAQPDITPTTSTPGTAPTPTEALVALGSNDDNQSGGEAPDMSALPNTSEAPIASEISPETAIANESGPSFTEELGVALSLERLRTRFLTGVRFSAAIFLIIFAVFLGKRLLEWTLSRAG